MSRHDPLYDWTDEVATQFPHLSKPQATVLALWSFGIVLAHSCTLPAVANILSPLIGRCYNTVRQRLREWYKPASGQAGSTPPRTRRHHLFCPVVGLDPQELAVPAGGLGAGCDQPGRPADRLVVEPGLPRDGHPGGLEGPPGQPTSCLEARVAEVVALVRRPSRSHLDGHRHDRSWPVCAVAVPGDRRLGLAPHDARDTAGQVPPRGLDRPQSFWQFVPRVGCTWQGRGVAFPRTPERRLACTLLACWTEGHEDGWYVLTDLPPQAADVAWYGLRMWIEHGFEQFKSAGWQWQKTRITEPDRAGRMWLAMALATFWVVAVGGATRARRGAPGDHARTARHRRSQARPGKPGRETAGQRVLPRDRRHPGPADQRPDCPAREVVSRAVAWN